MSIRGKVRRRTVYVATIAAMLALVGGFAMAATFSSTTVSQNQNGFSTSMGSTIWAAVAPTLTTQPSPTTTSCTSATIAITTATTATAFVGVESTASCTTNDFTEEVHFSYSVPAGSATLSDTFEVYSTATLAGATSATTAVGSVTVTVTETTSAYTATFDLYIDYGANPPASISSLSVVVSGS